MNEDCTSIVSVESDRKHVTINSGNREVFKWFMMMTFTASFYLVIYAYKIGFYMHYEIPMSLIRVTF